MGNTLIVAFRLLFQVLEYAILIDVILSWVKVDKNNAFIRILHTLTDPFLIPGRKIQEKLMPGFMLDFSPLIALFILWGLQWFIEFIL